MGTKLFLLLWYLQKVKINGVLQIGRWNNIHHRISSSIVQNQLSKAERLMEQKTPLTIKAETGKHSNQMKAQILDYPLWKRVGKGSGYAIKSLLKLQNLGNFFKKGKRIKRRWGRERRLKKKKKSTIQHLENLLPLPAMSNTGHLYSQSSHWAERSAD